MKNLTIKPKTTFVQSTNNVIYVVAKHGANFQVLHYVMASGVYYCVPKVMSKTQILTESKQIENKPVALTINITRNEAVALTIMNKIGKSFYLVESRVHIPEGFSSVFYGCMSTLERKGVLKITKDKGTTITLSDDVAIIL